MLPVGNGRWLLICALIAGGMLVVPGEALQAAAGMNGPPKPRVPPTAVTAAPVETVAARPLLGAIRFFQEYVSPADGARCRFAPTCSRYGHRAIRDHGPWRGVLMTADRLMRCSYLTDPAAYRQLPNGRLDDPVTANQEKR